MAIASWATRHAPADDQELVATEAADDIGATGSLADADGERAQHVVADRVTEAVVDDLEVVEIEEQHGGRCARGRALFSSEVNSS